ncbi:MAG TPA: DUF1566 domain-containing protein [Desulfosalsimonadaceae bacterium]|nr:DUF1566 domain-containing protein [Desulfosalsimonadaceae bacterium]
MERENFYILLDLSIDPPETDPGVIEKQIKKKKAEWSRLRNHPTKGLQAQKNISLIPEIEKVMLDPQQRAEELEAAKSVIRKGKESKFPEIDRHIDILMGKGYIAHEEVAKLAKLHNLEQNEIQDRINKKKQQKFGHIDRAISLRMDKGYITEAEIGKIAKRYSLDEKEVRKRVRCPLRKNDKESAEAEPRHIDKSLEKTINDNLKVLGKSSLYDFLDLPESADLESLQSQASRKKKELASISKKDATVTAGNTLAGHCMTIFKNEETRNAYDITLARSRLAALDSDIDIAAINGRVRFEYYDVLLQKAMEFGMDRQEAEAYISNYCSRKGYKLEKAPRKRKKQIALGGAAAACLLLLLVAGFVYHRFHQAQIRESEYRTLMTKVEQAPELAEKQKLLTRYLGSHQSGEYAAAVREKIQRIKQQIKQQQFEKAEGEAGEFKAAGKYAAAVDVYQRYIESHPANASYIKKARKKIQQIRERIAQEEFEKLQEIIHTGPADEKIAACRQYLEKHPDGRHSDQVSEWIREMSREYYIFVKNRLEELEKQEKWQQCIDLCENYIALYDNSRTDRLKQRLPGYKRRAKDNRILATLKDRAAAKDSYQAARQVYRDYLEAYPETTIADDIRREIERLEQKIRDERIQQAREKIRTALADADERFAETAKGVVLDKQTGLMWTLVDSSHVRPEQCLTYEMAQRYVSNLSTGGYSDWRLPTPEELAGIYKEKPFFPGQPERWYWSSENYSSYSDGWHKIVDTVSGKNTTSWQPEQRDATECGTVRPVRKAR